MKLCGCRMISTICCLCVFLDHALENVMKSDYVDISPLNFYMYRRHVTIVGTRKGACVPYVAFVYS